MEAAAMTLPIALFGPQMPRWTANGLSCLQAQITSEPGLAFLCSSLCSLPSLWGNSAAAFLSPGLVTTPHGFQQLHDFAAGGAMLDAGNLSNVHLAPLTLVAQAVELLQGGQDLWRFQSAQGFCVGFLAAAALSSAWTDSEFRSNISNAIRLAACLGLVVDGDTDGGFCAVTVQCKKPADRTLVDMAVDCTPGAYISCVTDEAILTIVLPEASQDSFASRLKGSRTSVKPLGLRGIYHHPKNAGSARILSEMCSSVSSLKLPGAQALRWPLRSTADGQVITSGELHDTAIQTILCQRAHWFPTVRSAAEESSGCAHAQFVCLGGEPCVPPSLVRKATEPATKVRGEVAIIGMASRFSGASDPEELWELIRSGVTRASKLPAGRFGLGIDESEAGANVGRKPSPAKFEGNFLDAPDAFDHRFFGISGLEAKSMDPQQRLVLQVVYEALESAGGHYQEGTGAGRENVGCYLGVNSADYDRNVADHDANAFAATGTLRAFISGRVSHFFGWSGPSLTIDTACSSSAVAIHTACRALLTGECALAVAGGVSIITGLDLYQNLVAASFLGKNGASRAFDSGASGYCRGEGAGVVLLKPLSRALADRDNILGVIAASGVENGAHIGTPITVPDSHSQSQLYRKVLDVAGIIPAAVTYVEAHGTGTPVGDPVEYESVRLALGGPHRDSDLFMGSLKDNIGHTEAASGVAAVIKVLLMMKHNAIPKQANFDSLNPRIKASPEDRIVIPQSTQPWRASTRIALANNYGAAGSNAAILIRSPLEHEQPTTKHLYPSEAASAPRPYPVLLSAKSAGSLHAYVAALGRFLRKNNVSLADVAFALSRRQNPSFGYRVSFTPRTVDELEKALSASLTHPGHINAVTERRRVVLCFGGQSGNTVLVAKDWYDRCDLLRSHLDECDSVCKRLGLPTIFPHIFDGRPTDDLVLLHCMLLALQVSTARSWLASGLKVDTLIGHSFGQLSALCVADAISLVDAFRLVSGRARLIKDIWGLEKGAMLAIECTHAELEAVVRHINAIDGCLLEVACYNGPQSFVLAGSKAAITEAEQAFPALKTKRLSSTHAYHSSATESVLPGYARIVAGLQIRPPRIMVETCTSEPTKGSLTADDIISHTREPVFFAAAVKRVTTRLPSVVWVEAGSESPVIPMISRIASVPGRQDIFVATSLSNTTADATLAQAARQLWEAGCGAVYWPFDPLSHSRYQYLSLPTYQFETPRHWLSQKPRLAEMPLSPLYMPRSLVQLIGKHNGGSYVFSVHTAHPLFQHAVRGHSVAGQSLCPASMYLELVFQCVAALAGVRNYCKSHVLQFKDVAMSAPLGTSLESSLCLSLQLCSSCSWKFSVFSRATNRDKGGETEHATGHVDIITTACPPAENRLQLLAKVARSSRVARITSAPSATKVAGPMVYQLFSHVVNYDDCYRGVISLSVSGNEAAGSVSMPPVKLYFYDEALCDPFSVDSFLQVAGIHINCLSSRKSDEIFICHQLDEVIFSTAFPSEQVGEQRAWNVYSSFEWTSAPGGRIKSDIFVYRTDTHDLVLAVLGATFQSVSSVSFSRLLQRVNRASGAMAPDTTSLHHMPPAREAEMVPIRPDEFPVPKSDIEPYSPPSYHTMPPPTSVTPQLSGMVCDMFSSIMETPAHEIAAMSSLHGLGIDSLLVTEVLNEIQRRFGTTVSVAEFQGCQDIPSLCRCIKAKTGNSPSTDPVSSPAEPDPRMGSNSPVVEPQSPTPSNIKETVAHDECQSLATQAKECLDQVKPCYNGHTREAGFVGFCERVLPRQSNLVALYVLEAFAALGCSLAALAPGEVVGTIPYHKRHEKLIPQLYKILQDASLIEYEGGLPRRTQHSLPSHSASVEYGAILDAFPQHMLETKLLHSTAHHLAECLSGTVDPVALLFGDVASRRLLGDVYQKAPMLQAITQALVQFLTLLFQRHVGGGGRKLRVLELGAGTGGTTHAVLEALAAMAGAAGDSVSYTFTDLSSSLVEAAERTFSSYPFVKYMVLDVEKAPDAEHQGVYDVVIAANCIHETANLEQSLGHSRQMLQPDGVLCLVEMTRNLSWYDLVFGLLEGWWSFQDGRHHSLADETQWARSLQKAGFGWVDWTDTDSEESKIVRLLVAASPQRAPPGGLPLSPAGVPGKDPITRESVVFKRLDDIDLVADIYYPCAVADADTKRRPVALMIHGGGHIVLSREHVQQQQVQLLLECGFLPISVDYRLCPETTLVEGPMADVGEAMAWIRNGLAETPRSRPDVQVDVERVVAVGWSTGGHLALTLGWTCAPRAVRPPEAVLAFYCPADYEDTHWTLPRNPFGAQGGPARGLDDTIWSGVCEKPITSYAVPDAVDGWISWEDARSRLVMYMNREGCSLDVLLGGLDAWTRRVPKRPNEARIRSVSPLAHILGGQYKTPTFLVHPRDDDLIPWQQAWRSWEGLRAAGVDAEVRVVDDVPHLFDMYLRHMSKEQTRRVVAEGYAFLCRHAGLAGAGSVDELADRLAAFWGVRTGV